MADNVNITKNANSTPPDGTVVATDQIEGVHYQRVVLVAVVDGSVVELVVNEDGHLVPLSHTENSIHDGNHYYISGFVTIDSGNAHYVKLVTPNTAVRAHFRWKIDSSAILETSLYKGAVGGMTGGSGVTPINNDHNSSNTSGLVITSGVTVATDKGTNIDTGKWGSRTAGADADRDDEMILEQNQTYFREFISGTNGCIVSFKALWVEE